MLYPISVPNVDTTNDLFGYIDSSGTIRIPPSYTACSHFSEGVASVLDATGKSRFIDQWGKQIFEQKFDGLGRFHEGLCAIGGGYIGHDGNWVIEPKFLVAGAFSEGFAIASVDGEHFGFINSIGSRVIGQTFQPCRHFSEGLAAVCSNGKWGYIDRNGCYKIPPVFDGPYATGFRCGLAGVRIDGHWGFIDRSGSFLVKPKYDELKPFRDGRACVKMNGKWGLIDTEGRLLLEYKFDELGRFRAGIASAQLAGKAGFLLNTGSWLVAPRFEKSYTFYGDLAVVRHDRAYSYISHSGGIVWTSEPGAKVVYPPPPLFV